MKQRSIINDFNAEDEWIGMPEFHQVKVEPFSTIKIRFETEQDLIDFAELVGQRLTPKTKSMWHPYKPHCGTTRKFYTYES